MYFCGISLLWIAIFGAHITLHNTSFHLRISRLSVILKRCWFRYYFPYEDSSRRRRRLWPIFGHVTCAALFWETFIIRIYVLLHISRAIWTQKRSLISLYIKKWVRNTKNSLTYNFLYHLAISGRILCWEQCSLCIHLAAWK